MGGLDDEPGALHVGGVHRLIILQPEVVAGGNVEAPVATAEALSKGFGVEEITVDAFVVGSLEAAEVAAGAEQGADPVALSIEGMDEVAADEA